jgi:hypothetical protein
VIYAAKHENGTEWNFASSHSKGGEHELRAARICVMNYCRKNRMPGAVTVTPASGETFSANITGLYQMADYIRA